MRENANKGHQKQVLQCENEGKRKQLSLKMQLKPK